jgi:hypothetical protein
VIKQVFTVVTFPFLHHSFLTFFSPLLMPEMNDGNTRFIAWNQQFGLPSMELRQNIWIPTQPAEVNSHVELPIMKQFATTNPRENFLIYGVIAIQ